MTQDSRFGPLVLSFVNDLQNAKACIIKVESSVVVGSGSGRGGGVYYLQLRIQSVSRSEF